MVQSRARKHRRSNIIFAYTSPLIVHAHECMELLDDLSSAFSLSLLCLFLRTARLVYAGNPIFFDMVFGAQMMRAPSYRRQFVSLYLTGRQLHRPHGGRSPVIGKCLFVLLLDLSLPPPILSPPPNFTRGKFATHLLYTSPFPSRCAGRRT